MKEMLWANKEGVFIYPIPIDKSEGISSPKCIIVVNMRGKLHTLKDVEYKQDEHLYEEIMKLYKRYYDKNRK